MINELFGSWFSTIIITLISGAFVKTTRDNSRIKVNNLNKYKLTCDPTDSPDSHTWAVVTGGTDGVGLCFAKDLAKQGFNILLISRTLPKLHAVADDIRKEYGTVVVKCMAHDFSIFDTGVHDRFYDQLKTLIKELDVGVLVNNVGVSYDMPTDLHEVPVKKLQDIMMVNVYGTTMMTHVLLGSKFIERNTKCAIVNVGSSAGTTPTPMLSVYSASKSFVASLTESIHHEHGDKIDVLLFAPGTLLTKMVGKKNASMLVPEPKPIVHAALKRLGIYTATNPHWVHYILDMLGTMPFIKPMWVKYVRWTLKVARTKILAHLEKSKDSSKKART